MLFAFVALVFAVSKALPAIDGIYQQRQLSIETLQLDIVRENRLIEETVIWRDRRARVEADLQQLHNEIFSGDTVAVVEASIQSELRQHARDAGITVSSTRLAEPIQTADWIVISQEVSFRTDNQKNTIAFLEKLEQSVPRLRVTEFSFNKNRNQYAGSITVVGFARSEGLILD